MQHIARRKRLDGIPETVTKEVEVSTLIRPDFLTLTGKPANQVAFKIVRDDNQEDKTMTQDVADTRRRRVRAIQRSSLLTIEFPEGSTEADVAQAVEQYGLTGYELVQDGDNKRLCLRRSDLTEPPKNAVSIKLADGAVAKVARSDAPPVTTPLPAIAVVAIEFKKENFADEAAAMAVIQRLDIDFLEKGVENTDQMIRVVRTEVEETTEVRRVEVEPGVIAVVSRADSADLGTASLPFIEVVSETAYGSWGWGQLDFAAALADIEFCNASEEASYRFGRVVSEILYYSELPIAIRKDLVSRAAEQYSAYIGSLLDGLPTKVVVINRSIPDNKEKQMKTEKTTKLAGAEGQGSQRTDDQSAAPTQDTPITRSEVAAIVKEAITAALAEATATKRTDADEAAAAAAAAGTEGEGEAVQKSGEDGKVLEAVETVTRSVADLGKTMAEVAERLSKIEGGTTVRSDTGDNAVADASASKDVFSGIFGTSSK